ncbi:MAG: hypothetical protein J6B37_04500 [Clostridia bacterium]|nr:hypothetical protein [Clostridia bacterium]
MTKNVRKFLAIFMCICISLPLLYIPVSASNTYDSVEEYVLSSETTVDNGDDIETQILLYKILNKVSDFFINDVVAKVLKLSIPDSAAVIDYESFDVDAYDNFYPGMENFINEPQGDKVWSLGYGKASILPEDFGEKRYAKGAYLPYVYGNEMYKDDDGNYEDLMVRVIIMNDGSGRGNVLFLSVDAMGLANSDVRLIRAALKEIAEKNNIVSINVSCTHIHTGIDSQGVWTDPLGCILNNTLTDTVKYGVPREFIESLVKGSVEAVEEALGDMTTGKMYYSSIDIEEYLFDRTAPISFDTNLYKLEFVPFNANKTPTVVATFGCHPESASFDWNQDESDPLNFDRKFTADFIWYTEKLMNSAGFNFIFIQGNVSTVSSSRHFSNDELDGSAHFGAMRYGYEIGYILLGMSMSESERIVLNTITGDKLGVEEYKDNEDYTIWYDGLPTVNKTEVKPVLNIKSKQFTVQIENNLIALLGKTSVADNLVLKDMRNNYYTVSEVGYMEIGDNMKVYMSPGETFGELLFGGNGANGFPMPTIREYTGEDIIIMDLMNDAAGYVANEANYVMAGYQYNELTGGFDSDTWCLISYGKHAGTTFIKNFYDVYDSVR